MSRLLILQLPGLNLDRQRLHRRNFTSSFTHWGYNHMHVGVERSSCSFAIHFPLCRISGKNFVSGKCGVVARHLRVHRNGRDRGMSTMISVTEVGGAVCQPLSSSGSGLRFVASTALALGLSLLVHHGTASSAEAVANFVVATFPWEKPQVLVQPEPSKGSCATCIGVVDETLGTCNSTPNCVSSFDDRPQFFVAPWEFPGQLSAAVQELKDTLLCMGADIISEPEERYVHAKFTDEEDGVIDDVEFLFSKPSEDATVVIRAASRAEGMADNDRNRQRLERIRSSLTWEQVPILRNRSRSLFFLESPWDSFGPEPPPTFDPKEGLEFVPE